MEAKISEDATINVKTMDGHIYPFLLPLTAPLSALKRLIANRLNVSEDRQRLIFRGHVLGENLPLHEHRIEDGQTVHMIAKAVHVEEPAEPVEQPREPAEDQERIDGEIVNNILRTLGETSLNRRNQRRRMMQQRTFGFPMQEQESLEVVRQNMTTVEQLLKARQDNGLPFNWSSRRLRLGQWIDVKDTIDQWLEAEVTKIEDGRVFVHYNGWGARWDEWIELCSPRIAPFRTHTVQSAYGFYLSPAPQNNLDGTTAMEMPQNDPNGMMAEFSEHMKQALELLDKINEMRNGEREEDDDDEADQNIDIQKKGEKYLLHKKNNKTNMDDNLSLKIEEKKQKKEKKYDEAISMKSLRLQHHKSNIKERNTGIISPNSMKTHTSNNSQFFQDDEVEEIIEEESRTLPSKFIHKKNANLLKKIRQREIAQRAQQLAPLFDRLGRAMVDLAPHIAILGSDLSAISSLLNVGEMSTATMNGSVNSNARMGLFDRFNGNNNRPVSTSFNVNPLSNAHNVYTGTGHITTQQDYSNEHQPPRGLHSDRPLIFQVPVMLNPGELLSIDSNSNTLIEDGHVDLHIQAIVKNSESGPKKDAATQTDVGSLNGNLSRKFSKRAKEKDSKELFIDEIEEDFYF